MRSNIVMYKPNELTPAEKTQLAKHEAIIRKGLKVYMSVIAAGNSLIAIRDGKLYRATHKTFEDYVNAKWQMSRPRAYQLIDVAKVTKELPADLVEDLSEGAIRELKKGPANKQKEVLTKAKKLSKNGNVTSGHIRKARGGSTSNGSGKPREVYKPDVSGHPRDAWQKELAELISKYRKNKLPAAVMVSDLDYAGNKLRKEIVTK